MTNPYPQQTHYAPPPPKYGRWKQWLQGAIGMYLVYAVTQFTQSEKALLVGSLAGLVAIGFLIRACLLARDEGREKRALAEEQMTGARPYGIVPPVYPGKTHRRPRFWVYTGIAATVGYAVAGGALLYGTATRATAKVSGSVLDGDFNYTTTPTVFNSGVVALVAAGSLTLTAAIVFFAVQAHLRINECIPSPAGWWDGAVAAPYDEQPAPTAGYGYPEQHASAQGYGYEQPAPQPEPSSDDPLADLVNNLSDEDFDRLRAHFTAPSASSPVESEHDAPQRAPRADEPPKPFGSTSSLDDLL